MINLTQMGEKAVTAKYLLQKADTNTKNKALLGAAQALCDSKNIILEANVNDITAAEANGMHSGLVDRLRLDSDRIDAMAEGLREIAALPDCIGEVMETFARPNGMSMEKRRVPIGVIGIIYESRPNVTADAFGLCFKTGNAVILKGGSDAIHSNTAIAKEIGRASCRERV